jgi:hypothetical protein
MQKKMHGILPWATAAIFPFPSRVVYAYIYTTCVGRSTEEYICAAESKETNLLSARPVSSSRMS